MNIISWILKFIKNFIFGFIVYGTITPAINSKISSFLYENTILSRELLHKTTIAIIGNTAIIGISIELAEKVKLDLLPKTNLKRCIFYPLFLLTIKRLSNNIILRRLKMSNRKIALEIIGKNLLLGIAGVLSVVSAFFAQDSYKIEGMTGETFTLIIVTTTMFALTFFCHHTLVCKPAEKTKNSIA